MALSELGDVLQTTNTKRAGAVVDESLALIRQLADALGETPYTMNELANRLDAAAELRRKQGNLAGAVDAAEEAASIRRRLNSSGTALTE